MFCSLQLVPYGRVQTVQMITNLRQFKGRGALAAAAPSPSLVLHLSAASLRGPAPAVSCLVLSKASQRRQTAWRQTAWRCLAAPQLHAAAATASNVSNAATAARAIQPGQVHIWWMDPAKVADSDTELLRWSSLLTEEELRDCLSSEDAAVRRERALARAHVRSVLAGYLEGSPHPRALLFGRNQHGKPHLLWPTVTPTGHTLRFNLTHTASLIGLAVTVEGLVGLDVEAAERRTRRDPTRLAQRRFSQQEFEDLQACTDEASRAAYFLQLWTLKEAYVKALGRGISAPPGLRSFTFRLGCSGEQQQQQEEVQMEQQQQQQQQQGWPQGKQFGNDQQHHDLEQLLGVQVTNQQVDGQRWQQGNGSGAWQASWPNAVTSNGSSSSHGCSSSVGVSSSSSGVSSSSSGVSSKDDSSRSSSGNSSNGCSAHSSSSSSSSVSVNKHSSGNAGSAHGSCNGSSSGGGGGGGSIQFHTSAPDGRCWQFALLQPVPGHMAALCVEVSSRCASSSDGSGAEQCASWHSTEGQQQQQGQQQQGLRLMSFEALPAMLPGARVIITERLAEPHVLAQGLYSP